MPAGMGGDSNFTSVCASGETSDGDCSAAPVSLFSSTFLTFKVPWLPDRNFDFPIPVRITFPRQTMRSNDRRHCIQNCVEIRRKTGTVINDITSKSNGIKLVHLNARSLKNREHLARIKELVNDEDVDVLAVSKPWLNSSTTNAEVEIPGYKIYRLDR